MSNSSEYDPKQLKNVALTPRQIEYIKRLVQADLHSREKDFRHAVAYGVDYDDPGMNIAAYALSSLDDPRHDERRERILDLVSAAESIISESDMLKGSTNYSVRGDLFKALDAAYDAIEQV